MLDRTKFLGGSDMPIILGLSNFKTPYQLYLEKLGLNPIEYEDTPLQYWGKQIEPLIRNEFTKRHNVIVTDDELACHAVHSEYDFLCGHVDGFIPEYNAVFEAKCANSFMGKDWGEPNSDQIPLSYLIQVAFYCALTKADKAYISVLVGGYDYREYIYTKSAELETKIINAGVEFWQNMQEQIEPRLQDIEDIKLKYNFAKVGKSVNATDDILHHLGLLASFKERAKNLAKKELESKKEIMEFMQDAECLTDTDGTVLATWKTNKKKSRTFLLKANAGE